MVDLSIKDANATGGGCGCGCGGHDAKADQAAPASQGAVVADYTVTGMTCGHCVAAVTEEVKQIPGVTDVAVTLEDGRLVVTSTDPVDFDRVVEAVAEAGDYTLA